MPDRELQSLGTAEAKRRFSELVDRVGSGERFVVSRRGRDRARDLAELEAEGRRLDEPDMRIASIALSRELTLITGNVRHFSRVPGLSVENWPA